MTRTTHRMAANAALAAILLFAAAPPPAGAVTLESLTFPGTPEFAATARDVIAVRFAVDPSEAAGAGFFEAGASPPSFSPGSVAALTARLERDLAALRGMPWRSWDKDRQIDWRWIYANAEELNRQLQVERRHMHRPAAWLEPFSNSWIALLTYAPERTDLRRRLMEAVPAMVREMREVCTEPTARDVSTATGVAEGMLAGFEAEPPSRARDQAVAALRDYADGIEALEGLPRYRVIGRRDYEWRLDRVLLLPWDAQQLLALALRELTWVDAEMDSLRPRISEVEADATDRALADSLTQERLLAMYDAIATGCRAFLDTHDLVTVPVEVGPIRTRPTPEAMIPLTGDGGSMNPPPPMGAGNLGWWNVEHFRPDWTPERRLKAVVNARHARRTGMGPYAVHEGVPGHHLQLSLSRLHPNPIRKLLFAGSLVEGWALYSERIFWEAGGLGDSPEAEYRTLNSWRSRIRRVFYDVHVECGDWTLQDAADFRAGARPGEGEIGADVLRAINWPTQLIGYFAGRMQIMELREDYRAKLGPAYTDRAFHDALLAEGSIPVALIRAKLLDEPVPGI